ncbi:MFS transporter [Streptomyces sp. NPDC058193]|uniref:MFS transporter n=1 Tax=Streptomyces sp. NPDC058193 TaxID=3346373 RepID=UPI0036E2BED4
MRGPKRTAGPPPWRDRRFRRFWAGHAISQFGDRITELALPLLAAGVLNASAGQVALLTALVWTPNLLAVLLGAWVDHQVRKRRLMILADLVRAAVLLSVPAAYLLDAVTLHQLYVVAVLMGTAGVLFNTAYPPFFAGLVPRASYVDANSRLSAARSASHVAGPAVGGALIQLLAAPLTLAVDALTFLVSAVVLGRVQVDEHPVEVGTATPPLARRAKEGLAFVIRHPVLRGSLGCCATVNFFTFIGGSGLIVLFADRDLGLSAGLIGTAFGVGATGSLLGAVAAPAVSRRFGVGRSVVVGAVLFPAAIAVTAAADGAPGLRAGALAASVFLSGFGVMLFDVNLNALQTAVTPDGVRSRVAGAFSTINYGIRPVGALTGGLLATTVGLRATLLVAAVGGVVSLLWLLPSPIPGIRSLAPDTRVDTAA